MAVEDGVEALGCGETGQLPVPVTKVSTTPAEDVEMLEDEGVVVIPVAAHPPTSPSEQQPVARRRLGRLTRVDITAKTPMVAEAASAEVEHSLTEDGALQRNLHSKRKAAGDLAAAGGSCSAGCSAGSSARPVPAAQPGGHTLATRTPHSRLDSATDSCSSFCLGLAPYLAVQANWNVDSQDEDQVSENEEEGEVGEGQRAPRLTASPQARAAGGSAAAEGYWDEDDEYAQMLATGSAELQPQAPPPCSVGLAKGARLKAVSCPADEEGGREGREQRGGWRGCGQRGKGVMGRVLGRLRLGAGKVVGKGLRSASEEPQGRWLCVGKAGQGRTGQSAGEVTAHTMLSGIRPCHQRTWLDSVSPLSEPGVRTTECGSQGGAVTLGGGQGCRQW
ncbi:hypothetical protein HaLaN_05332 [Haematococcus lacustris]|uniref:Uncharacterized protein n=1 Tax=Haematococcus lacustris TaxID=44745 RepID=A0A699YKP8_HAELA|nr:hypothetical protein HaLaN_05332 [Haematococcus lacustris]